MSLPDTIKQIQREVGAEPDGIFGPITAARVLAELQHRGDAKSFSPELNAGAIDARTAEHLASLDDKAKDRFRQFILLAKATAATFGVDYIGIEGHRTWEEQDALFAIGRSKPGQKVTNAQGGYSNHNFGIAMDFGVFRGKSYLDTANPALASKVHAACAVHARKLGFEWGGDWKSMKDYPHFEISTGLSIAQKRELYRQKGSVL